MDVFEFNGVKYRPKDTEKADLAKKEVSKIAKELLLKYEDDDEMFVFILMELKNYGVCGLDTLDMKIGFEGIQKYVLLEKI